MINKVLLILVIIIIIFFIIFDKKINDNFTNYNITKIGNSVNDINIDNDGKIISINADKHTLQANELCIGDRCLNLQDTKNKSLPRDSGSKGICTLNQCYDCDCLNGTVVIPRDCNKPGHLPVESRQQCQACDLGYELVELVDENDSNNIIKKCKACDIGTYNKETMNTDKCINCNDCPNGKHKINCNTREGTKTGGTCALNECLCTHGTPKENGSCVNNNGQACASCDKGYKLGFSPDGNGNISIICKPCGSEEYMKNNGNVTYRCPQKTQCGNNQYEINPGNTTTDRSCGNCNNYTCPLSSRFLPQYRENCGNGAEGNCRECEACPGGQYRKNCGGNDPGTCVPCGGCEAGKHKTGCEGIAVRVSSNTTYGSCTPNVCKCHKGQPVDNGAPCPTHGENRCKSCQGGYYLKGTDCAQCEGCGAHPAYGCLTSPDWGYTACYDGPSNIPANLFIRRGCGGSSAGNCQLKDNVTFLCGTGVNCNYASFAMCAHNDGGGQWAKDWNWGHSYYSVYGNRQIKNSYICARWPSTNEINNPNRHDGSSDANVLVYSFHP